MGQIDLSQIISNSIPSVDHAKRMYDLHILRDICTNFVKRQYNNYYKIFTDGSKDSLSGGAAFLDPHQNCSLKLRISSDISIMHIELAAIAEALSYVRSVDYDKFVILTDSRSSLQHLARCTSHVRGNPIAYQILELILNLQNNNREIILQWIPAHINFKENEEVDLLAKQACTDGIPTNILPLFSDHVRLVKKQCHSYWQEYFDERSKEKGIWYKTIQPLISHYPWIETIALNRKSLVTALRLRSGHIPSKKFSFLMKKVASPNCVDCGVIEDVHHVLWECVRNSAFRSIQFGAARGMDIGFCNSVLAEPSSDSAQILYKLLDLSLSLVND